MKALILAGGLGTRLRPLSCTRPKILFPILNKPLLQWTFERLAWNGIKEVILAVNKQTEVLIRQQRIRKCGLRVTYSLDPPKMPLGTGGPIKKAEKLIGHDSPFLVLNGDVFADLSYTKILKEHEENRAVATIALHEVEDPSRFGVAELHGKRIKRFVEKPRREEAPTNLINAGVYALSPKIFDYIPGGGRMVSLEREIFPKLAEKGELYGYVFSGFWSDVGEPEDYMEVNKFLLDSHAKKRGRNVECRGEIREPVALDDGVSIGEESIVGPYAILGKNVTVGRKTEIQNAIIFPETTVSDYVSVNNAIIGERVIIGVKAKIGGGCILADGVKVKDGVSLVKKVSVCPAKEVTSNAATCECII